MDKAKEKRRKAGRVVALLLCFFFLVSILGVAVFFALSVSPEEDEALFRAAGYDTVTRLYYHDETGEAVEGLQGYLAVEWGTERIHGGEICLRSSLSEISPHVQNAFVAIEDHRFYRHFGVDVLRTARAVVNRLLGSESFGGSTITQQLIKNIGGEKEKTVSRKAREIARAISLERRHTKSEILEAYLNIVPLSGGYIGVGAAALAYFGKAPSALSVAEAASLAAITKAPALYDPYAHPDAHVKRRNTVITRMWECGYITESEAKTAKEAPLVLREKKPAVGQAHSWYTETVISDVMAALEAQGYTRATATALIYRGGLRIYTAMDKEAQGALDSYFSSHAHFASYGEGFSAAAVILSPKTGDLLAICGGTGIKTADRLLNRATDTLRPPGSALKPLALYAPAIEEGIVTEATVFDDVPQSFSDAVPWPRNSPDRYDGLIPVSFALSHSKNTVAVSLYRSLGAEHIYSLLTARLGFSTLVRRAIDAKGNRLTDLAEAPLALGQLTYGVSLRDLCEGYLPLANDGVKQSCRSYYLVTDNTGRVLLRQEAEGERVFSAATASVMTHMLGMAVEEGSAEGLSVSALVDTAGKTGTTAGGKDRWFIGYTPYYLCGIWCGTEGKESIGGRPHLDAFDAVMLDMHSGKRLTRHFQRHSSLAECRVCRDSGKLLCEACAKDPRGERSIMVWLPAHWQVEKCDRHVSVYYDTKGDGVVPLPTEKERRSLTTVGLLSIPWRDFPVQVRIADAEYVYRPLGDTPPATGDCAFFESLLASGHFAGQSHEGRPFNALAKKHSVKEPVPKKREALPPISLREEKRQETGDPVKRFFYRIFKR